MKGFALGDDEGAFAAGQAALDSASDEEREELEGYLSKVEAAVASASSVEGLSSAEMALVELETSEYRPTESLVHKRK